MSDCDLVNLYPELASNKPRLPPSLHTYEEVDVTVEAAKRRIEQLLGNNKVIDITPRRASAASQKAGGDDARGTGGSLRKTNGS
jgi:hypothetical protein